MTADRAAQLSSIPTQLITRNSKISLLEQWLAEHNIQAPTLAELAAEKRRRYIGQVTR